MSALGQLLGRAYANKYGAKYDLPMLGNNGSAAEADDDNVDMSQFAVGASQGVPLQTSPVPIPIAPKAPATPTWLDMTLRTMANTADYAFGPGKFIEGFRYLENAAKPYETSDSSIARALGTTVSEGAKGMKNMWQAVDQAQNLLNVANITSNFVGNIFGRESTVIPKLDNFRDQEAAGFGSAGQVGHLVGDLASVIASFYIGGAGAPGLAAKFPALATAVEDIPGISNIINTVSKVPGVAGLIDATGLGASSAAKVIGTGTGNALLSALGDSREVLEEKKKVKDALIDATAAGLAGTLYGGATSPTASIGKRILAEGAINTIGGGVQEAPALLRSEITPAQYGMNVGIQGAAGMILPALAAAPGGLKQMVRNRKLGNIESPIETPIEPNAPASVSQAAVDQARTTTGTPDEIALQQQIDREKYSKEVEGFVKKHYKNKSSREDLGMGTSSKEIADNLVSHTEQNPHIVQLMDEINAGNARPEDLGSAIRNSRTPEPVVQEPVVAENAPTENPVVKENLTTQPPPMNPDDLTPEQIGGMAHEELSKHYTTRPVEKPVDNVEIGGKLPESNVQEMHIPNEYVGISDISPTRAENAQVESRTVDGVTYERPKPFVSFDEQNNPVPTAENVVIGKPTEVLFNTQTEPAHYVVHPSDYSVPSHRSGIKNPHNFLGNPQAKEGRAGVEYVNGILRDWKPENMSGTDKNAFQNAPKTILPNGEPIQGNTRAELEQRIYENPNSEQALKLKQHILDNAEHFGVSSPEQRAAIEAMQNPTVSRVVNPTKERANELLNIHQDEAAWAKTPTDESTLRVSKVSPQSEKRAFDYLEQELSKEENSGKSFMQMLETDTVRQDVATILSNGDQRTMKIYTDDISADKGKNAIEFDLRSMVFRRDEDAIKKFNALPNKYKETINANLANILRLGDDKLGKDFKEAIQGLFDYSEFRGQKKNVDSWLNQIDMNGHVNEDKYGKGAVELMRLMDNESPATVRKVLNEYTSIPKDYRAGEQGMFGEAPRTHAELLTAAKKKVIAQDIKDGTRLNSSVAPAIAAAVSNIAAQAIDDDKEYFGMKGSTLKNAIAMATIGGAMGYYGHKLVRSLKVSLPESAPRVLERIKETTIPGYEDTKLKVSEIKGPVIQNLVGKAKADGMTDELVAHHIAFMDGQQNNPKYIDQVQSELFGNEANPKSEMDAADYLLKQTIHAHNGQAELPVMSERLHDLILNTIDERTSNIKNPEAAHVANLMQGRELSLPEKPIESMPAELTKIQDVGSNWQQDLYSIATGDDPALKNVLDKLKKGAHLNSEEVQIFKKYLAEKEVWNKSVETGVETGDWDSVLKIKDAIDDPVRKAAYSEFVATKLDDVVMDKEVNAIAAENGLEVPEPTPNYKPKSQALYSTVVPLAPGTFEQVKKLWTNPMLRNRLLVSGLGYAVGDRFFDNDKEYLGISGQTWKMMTAAGFLAGFSLPHLRRIYRLKYGSPEVAAKMYARINAENLLSQNIHTVVAADPKFRGKEGTPEFIAEVKRKEAESKALSHGLSHGINAMTSVGGAGHRRNPIGMEVHKAQQEGNLIAREHQSLIEKKEAEFQKFSTPDQDAAVVASAAADRDLGIIRAATKMEKGADGKMHKVSLSKAEKELLRLKALNKIKSEYLKSEGSQKAFDTLQQKMSVGREMDIHGMLLSKYGIKYDEIPDAIGEMKVEIKKEQAEIDALLKDFANEKDPAQKRNIKKSLETKNFAIKKSTDKIDGLEYMHSLPEQSDKYHYLPHFWDKDGDIKFAVHDNEGNLVSYHKFRKEKEAGAWLTQFKQDRINGKHSYGEPVRKQSPASKSTKGSTTKKMDVDNIMAIAYSENTANFAKSGLGRHKVVEALKGLDGWNDLDEQFKDTLIEAMEDNVSPKTLQHILDEIAAPRFASLEKRNNVGGYIDFNPDDFVKGKWTPRQMIEARKWVLGGIDHMNIKGRMRVEKSLILRTANRLKNELYQKGYADSAAFDWLNESVLPSVTPGATKQLSKRNARWSGAVRTTGSALVLGLNPLHGLKNYGLGSISTLAETMSETTGLLKRTKGAGAFVMAHALNTPGIGGVIQRFSSPEMREGMKLLEKYNFGESQAIESQIASTFKYKKTARGMMLASILSETANNKIAGATFLKIGLDKGYSVEEAAKYAMMMREQTQYAFTPWMTTKLERNIRGSLGGLGNIGLALMGATLRNTEHVLSMYYRAPKTSANLIGAASYIALATLFGGIYGDVVSGTVLKAADFIRSHMGDDDDTNITKESFAEEWMRHSGDLTEKLGYGRHIGERYAESFARGEATMQTGVNFTQNNDITGLLHPLIGSESVGLYNATTELLSDKSAQEKILNFAKLSTAANRVIRAGMQLSEGHPMDNKGNQTSDRKYAPRDAALEIAFGRPANDTWNTAQKAAGGGDLRDEYSKQKFVSSLYDLPGLKVGNEKNEAQRTTLTENAQTIRRQIQKTYDATSKERATEIKKINEWAEQNKELMNWIDRNGGAEVAGNITAPSKKALTTNIEKWYTAKSAAEVLPGAKFRNKKGAFESAAAQLIESGAKKAKSKEQKKEFRELVVGLKK